MNEELINDEVIKLAQNGDQEALDLILKEYKKLIYLNIRNYFLVGADQDDLLQEGTIGLLKAIKNYSEGKASFKTFATLCIRRQILTAVRSSTAQKNSALNEASGNNLETEDGHEDYPKELYSNVRYNPEAIFLSKEKIMEELNVTDKTVLFHFRKLKKVYPDLELTRDPINSYNTVRTDSIQRLLREGKTIEEISGIMNIKEESVKCNIRRYESKMIVKSKTIKPSVDYSTVAYKGERLQNQIKTV